jgi:hypothetical protein
LKCNDVSDDWSTGRKGLIARTRVEALGFIDVPCNHTGLFSLPDELKLVRKKKLTVNPVRTGRVEQNQ